MESGSAPNGEATKVEGTKSSQFNETTRHYLASLAGSLTGKLAGGIPFREIADWFQQRWLQD